MNKIVKTILLGCSLLVSQQLFAADQSNVKSSEKAPVSAASAVTANAGQVNINTADAATLSKELDGIGDVKAQAIVDYRTQNGPFKTVEDLAKVTGIGAATIEKNKSKVVLQ